MSLMFTNPDPQPGDQYLVMPGGQTGMTTGVVITRTEHFGWDASNGTNTYVVSQEWLTNGWLQYLGNKETDMSLVFEEEETKENVPAWGQQQVDNLSSLIEMADAVSDRKLRHDMYDCINARYRTKAYRDHIKTMQDLGYITGKQVGEMHGALTSIRHQPRTPQTRAYRYAWPN